jgi:hypothetical protein
MINPDVAGLLEPSRRQTVGSTIFHFVLIGHLHGHAWRRISGCSPGNSRYLFEMQYTDRWVLNEYGLTNLAMAPPVFFHTTNDFQERQWIPVFNTGTGWCLA